MDLFGLYNNMSQNAELSPESQLLASGLADTFNRRLLQNQVSDPTFSPQNASQVPQAPKNILDEAIKEKQADRDLKLRIAEYKLQQKLADERMAVVEKDKRDFLGKILIINGLLKDRGMNGIPLSDSFMPSGSFKAPMLAFPKSTLDETDAKVRQDTLNTMVGLDNADIKLKLYSALLGAKGKSMPNPGNSKGNGTSSTAGTVTVKDIWKRDNKIDDAFTGELNKVFATTKKDMWGKDVFLSQDANTRPILKNMVYSRIDDYAPDFSSVIERARAAYGSIPDTKVRHKTIVKQIIKAMKKHYKGQIPYRIQFVINKLPNILSQLGD